MIALGKESDLVLPDQQQRWQEHRVGVTPINSPERTDAFGSLAPGARRLSDGDLQRAAGSGRIALSGSASGTRVIELFHRSPVRILLPRTAGSAVEEAVVVNIGGGIAGGDRLNCEVTALDGASVAVTSQAAERIYCALSEPACIATKLAARGGARLAWLPQETILFNRARLRRETQLDVSSGAEVLALEWLVLGRAAHGEELLYGEVTDSWRVKLDGRLVWADTFRAGDQTFPNLRRKALLSDHKAVATLVYFGPLREARQKFLREVFSALDCQCGATSIGALLIARFGGTSSCSLRFALRSLLEEFGREAGAGPFRVPKMWTC